MKLLFPGWKAENNTKKKLRGGSKENVIRSVFDEFEDGVEKVQPYTKKSQQNGNVCRLIVSKSALIKHVSRGEVF